MRGYDSLTVLLALSAVLLFALLVYVVVGPLGVLAVPFVIAVFYLLPGDIPKSVDANGVRLALLLVNGKVKPSKPSHRSTTATRKEVRVPDEGHIYVFGSAKWSDEHGQTTISGEGASFFKISDSSEAELIKRYRMLAMLSAVTAFVGLPVGSWLALRASGVL